MFDQFIKNIYLRLLVLFYDENYYDNLIKNSNFILDYFFYIKYLIKNDKIKENIDKILKKNKYYYILIINYINNIEILKKLPQNSLVLLQLFNCYLDEDNLDEADKCVKLIEKNSYFANYYLYRIAIKYFEKEQYKIAKELFTKLYENSIIYKVDATFYLGRLLYEYDNKSSEEIENMLKTFAKFNYFYLPIRFKIYEELAWLYNVQDNHQESEKYHLKLDSWFNKNRHNDRLNIGLYYEEKRNYQKALEFYKLEENTFEGQLKLANLYFKDLNNINLAKKYYEKISDMLLKDISIIKKSLFLNSIYNLGIFTYMIEYYYQNKKIKKTIKLFKLLINLDEFFYLKFINRSYHKKYFYQQVIDKNYELFGIKNYYLLMYANYEIDKKYKKKYYIKLSLKIDKYYPESQNIHRAMYVSLYKKEKNMNKLSVIYFLLNKK